MPSGDDDCQKNSIITSEKKDYDGTRFGLWFYKSSKLKKIHLKSYEILFLKNIFGKISVDAWDWANDLKSYDTTVKNVS